MARILIADDEEMVVTLISRLLTDEGHQVVVSSDGQQALKLAMTEDFDLYVLDVRMPRLDGYSLSLSITKKFPGRKVIIITALDVQKYKMMSDASGAFLTISKPFRPKDFTEAVRKALSS